MVRFAIAGSATQRSSHPLCISRQKLDGSCHHPAASGHTDPRTGAAIPVAPSPSCCDDLRIARRSIGRPVRHETPRLSTPPAPAPLERPWLACEALSDWRSARSASAPRPRPAPASSPSPSSSSNSSGRSCSTPARRRTSRRERPRKAVRTWREATRTRIWYAPPCAAGEEPVKEADEKGGGPGGKDPAARTCRARLHRQSSSAGANPPQAAAGQDDQAPGTVAG